MPGFSFIHYFEPASPESRAQIEPSLNSLLHEPEYKKLVLIDEATTFLAATKHPAYMVEVIDYRDFFVCLDGHIYGKRPKVLRAELIELARALSTTGRRTESLITDWLLSTDGEFLLFIKDKQSGHKFLLNDYRGLLPFYYYKGKRRLLCSREVRFILNLLGRILFDKYSLAQYLILNYVLGGRTLFKDVHRFPPGSLIRIRSENESFEIITLCNYNYENQHHVGKSLSDNVEILVELFDQACRNRTPQNEGTSIVLGMSGGRDSRAVCSGLTRVGAKFHGLSYCRPHDSSVKLDVEIAKEVAQRFGIDWQMIEIFAPTGKDLLKLLKLKSGLNGLGLAFMICFLTKIRSMYNELVTYATGDTGMALRAYLPTKNLHTMDALLNYIISHDGCMTPVQAAKLLGLNPQEILDCLRADLEIFPEKSFNRKYTHFSMSGRGFTWHHEGMDRNRCYTHLITPLEAQPFVNYALHCSQVQKKKYRLYDAFLSRLSEKNQKLRLTNYNAAAGSFNNLSLNTKRLIKTHLLRNWSSYGPSSFPLRCMREIFNKCHAVDEYFNRAETEKMMEWCSKIQLDNIFSLVATIEEYSCPTSMLEHHPEVPFI
jgi:asparagine synthase (glutamine-hydrolysing)